MPTYVTLYKWTEQGIKNVKQAPERVEAAKKASEAMGGKILGLYVTLGEYDLVTISEWPSDEAGMVMLLAQGAQGNVRSTTLKAFAPAEFAKIVKKMP